MSFYVTTPIYYVNSNPHLGHAYTTILCDFMKRSYELLGEETYFLTGTDEHGDKISKAAQAEGITEQELTDKNSENFRHLLKPILCENDDFIRTTEERHKKVVQALLQKVYDSGDIYKAEYSGKYCVGCERYLGDDELEEGKCPDHQKEPELITEENYFFKMSKFWKQLQEHIAAHPNFITPEGFKNEVLGLLKQEPQDLCISRPKSRLTWGIELPFDTEFVTYVWFDALINYISALGYPDNEKFKTYWKDAHHVIAKDILKPHCIYWPTMLMSMGIDLPKQVAIHGYLLSDDAKMSKSLGNVVDPFVYCEKYSADVFRYFLIRYMRFGKDASFTHEEFINISNAELSNNFGNLYSRTIGMCKKNSDKKVPALGELTELDKELLKDGQELKVKLEACLKIWSTAKYTDELVEYGNKINKYLDEMKPWSLSKEEDQAPRVKTILRTTLEAIRIVYTWLWPMCPVTCERILGEMGQKSDLDSLKKSLSTDLLLEEGFELPKKTMGFARIEEEK